MQLQLYLHDPTVPAQTEDPLLELDDSKRKEFVEKLAHVIANVFLERHEDPKEDRCV